jgi:acyl carrier protein
MSDRVAIQKTIREFILREFPAARLRDVRDDDGLLEKGIVDSLGVLDIVAFLESQFGLKIADDELELEDFASIEALSAFVHRKLNCLTGS